MGNLEERAAGQGGVDRDSAGQSQEPDEGSRGLGARLEIVLESLADLNLLLSDTDALYANLLERLVAAVPFYSGSIQVLEGDSLKIVAYLGPMDPAVIMGLRFYMNPLYPNYEVIAQRTSMAYADIRLDFPHFHDRQEEFSSGHIRSWLGVPMRVGDAVIGMIALDRNRISPFRAEDILIAQAFADNAAVAIRNSRTYHKLQEALADRDRMMREVHHRVKNSLQLVTSLVSIEAGRMKAEEDAQVLQELIPRIESIARAHQILSRSLDEGASLDPATYFAEVVEDFREAYFADRDNPALVASFESMSLGMAKAVPLGLVLNEILTNAAKYAFPEGRTGRIKVELSRVEGGALLLVEDDGVGIQAAATESSGFGMESIKGLARQIGGRAELETRPGLTRWSIFFPPG